VEGPEGQPDIKLNNMAKALQMNVVYAGTFTPTFGSTYPIHFVTKTLGNAIFSKYEIIRHTECQLKPSKGKIDNDHYNNFPLEDQEIRSVLCAALKGPFGPFVVRIEITTRFCIMRLYWRFYRNIVEGSCKTFDFVDSPMRYRSTSQLDDFYS
jgi:hypothetical protein